LRKAGSASSRSISSAAMACSVADTVKQRFDDDDEDGQQEP
jgi:hypothetical protein